MKAAPILDRSATLARLFELAKASTYLPEAADGLDKALKFWGSHLTRHEKGKIAILRTGLVGLLFKTKSRETGTLASVYLTEVFTGPEDAKEGKYTVVCEDHSTCVLVSSLSMGRHTAAHPRSFCDYCRGEPFDH